MIKILSKNIQAPEFVEMLSGEKPSFVEDSRWEKIQLLKQEKDKLRSLVSAYLLNKMCEELEIESPRYEYGEKGKPYLAGQENVVFNLSHSGEYAVLAYAANTDEGNRISQQEEKAITKIGIDIQEIRPMKEGMIHRILHEKEKSSFFLSEEEPITNVNRVWCIKESYVKMLGVGLSLDFRNIVIDFDKQLVKAEGDEGAFFAEVDSRQGYVLAVCCNRDFQFELTEC